jgi:hypothetical protein
MADRYAPVPVPGVRPVQVERVSTFWTWTALLIALVGVWGTLWLTFVLGLTACPLCFFQRVFMMGTATVLLVGLFGGQPRSGYLSLVTLPLTVAGLGIAGMHVYLEYDGKLQCPDGVLVLAYENWRGDDEIHQQLEGFLTPPKESLIVFTLLFLVQIVDVIRSRTRGGFGLGALLAAMIVGGGLCYGTWASRGPSPTYAPEVKVCRPPKAAP